MPAYFTTILDFALVVHLLLIAVCVARLCRGRTPFDRLLAVDLIGTLLLAIMVLLAIREQLSLLLDVALGLAAVGFTGSILLAKYVADDTINRPQGLGRVAPPEEPKP